MKERETSSSSFLEQSHFCTAWERSFGKSSSKTKYGPRIRFLLIDLKLLGFLSYQMVLVSFVVEFYFISAEPRTGEHGLTLGFVVLVPN